ncbi:hypothetical protein AB9F35_37125, partial [Rhizobium leguminosarum]
FAKFAAGPYGASVVVPGTGYVPNNDLAAKSADYLGDFYKQNPLFQAGTLLGGVMRQDNDGVAAGRQAAVDRVDQRD